MRPPTSSATRWAPGDPRFGDALRYFILIRELVERAAPRADEIVSTPQGMRRATEVSVAHFEHIPPELIGSPARARGVGHCPQLDCPGTTAELILAFTGHAGG